MDNDISFRTICRQNGLEVKDHQLASLQLFAERLLAWNSKINLISRKDEQNLWPAHILHSASILFKVKIPPASRILDLGTGGGLPGIPLKILLPTISLTLLDSTQKKINVVNDLIKTLGLTSAHGVWGRAEELGATKEFHQKFDVVVARAVASLKDLIKWSHPFLIPGRTEKNPAPTSDPLTATPPSLIALKGGNLENELRGLENDSKIRSIRVADLTLKGSDQFEGGDKKIVLIHF